MFMEIQGDEIVLSPRDIYDAFFGSDAVLNQEFQEYIRSLMDKLHGVVPGYELVSEGSPDRSHFLRVPYSRKTAEMLGAAIASGAESRVEIVPLVREAQAQQPLNQAKNRKKYAKEARKHAKSRFTVVRNEED